MFRILVSFAAGLLWCRLPLPACLSVCGGLPDRRAGLITIPYIWRALADRSLNDNLSCKTYQKFVSRIDSASSQQQFEIRVLLYITSNFCRSCIRPTESN